LDFRLPRSGIVGVIGPNGAGKTTLFRMLVGEDKPDSGELKVGNTVKIAYVDQSRSSLKADNSVWQEISGGQEKISLGSREIASRAAAFGMDILYFQRTRLPPGEEATLGVSYRPLQDLLAQSDWVVPQLPADPSTRHFIDRERLALLKPGACLVNVSRAEAVERNALIEALRSGHLGGFALDPLYEEPGRPDDELLAFDNVILTPHLAGSPRSNGLRDIEQMITELAQALFE